MSRTLIALVALTLGVPAVALAQSAPAAPPAATAPATPGTHHHHQNRYYRALKTINLSDAQRQQIRGFMKATRQANANADPATRKANMQQLRAQIDGVLTPDQRTQLQTALAAPPAPVAPAK